MIWFVNSLIMMGMIVREIKNWEWFSYWHDGMTTTICMACIKEYEKVLGGKQ